MMNRHLKKIRVFILALIACIALDIPVTSNATGRDDQINGSANVEVDTNSSESKDESRTTDKLTQPKIQEKEKGLKVKVTSYMPNKRHNPKKPYITASGKDTRKLEYHGKLIALSSDLSKKYKFGDKFQLHVKGKVYDVAFYDVMNCKWKCKVDLLLATKSECNQIGSTIGYLVKIK